MDNTDQFAISTELTIEDMRKVNQFIEESVNRGTWKFNELNAIMELHTKIAALVSSFDARVNQGE